MQQKLPNEMSKEIKNYERIRTMKIENLEVNREKRIEALSKTVRRCEYEMKRLQEEPEICDEEVFTEPGELLLEQGVFEEMMRRIKDTLNWCYIDPLGNPVLDFEMLRTNIDYRTLWRIYCCALCFEKSAF